MRYTRRLMSLKKTVAWTGAIWLALITGLHAWLNLDLFRRTDPSQRSFKVGFLPVT